MQNTQIFYKKYLCENYYIVILCRVYYFASLTVHRVLQNPKPIKHTNLTLLFFVFSIRWVAVEGYHSAAAATVRRI